MTKPIKALSKRAILAAQKLRDRRPEEGWDIRPLCHPGQLRVLDAIAAGAGDMCLVTPRQWGKSTLVCLLMVDAAIGEPDAQVIYVGTSRRKARQIIWGPLCSLVRDRVPGARITSNRSCIEMPNGSTIWLAGCADRGELHDLRGFSPSFVAIDEARDYEPMLGPLVQDVIRPSGWTTGLRIMLIGTPDVVRRGFFWEASQGLHGFTALSGFDIADNLPGIENARRVEGDPGLTVEDIKDLQAEKMGLSRDDPTFRREFLAEWVEDDNALVWHWAAERNGFTDGEHPMDRPIREGDPGFVPGWQYVVGLDTGKRDADAIAVLGFNPERSPDCFLVHEDVASEQGWDVLEDKLRRIVERFDPIHVVYDPAGGAGKMAEDLAPRWGIVMEAARKVDRSAQVALMDGDLRRGRLRVRAGSKCATEMPMVRWRQAEGRREPTGGRHSDIIDAVRYGFMRCRHHMYRPDGTPVAMKPKEQRDTGLEPTRRDPGRPWWRVRRHDRRTGSGFDAIDGLLRSDQVL